MENTEIAPIIVQISYLQTFIFTVNKNASSKYNYFLTPSGRFPVKYIHFDMLIRTPFICSALLFIMFICKNSMTYNFNHFIVNQYISSGIRTLEYLYSKMFVFGNHNYCTSQGFTIPVFQLNLHNVNSN